MTTLWDTTGTAVVKALSAERRKAGSVSSGLALTLVVVVEEGRVEEAEQDESGGAPHLYRAGEWGPRAAEEMLARDGRVWRRP